jgi:hypothetical protein
VTISKHILTVSAVILLAAGLAACREDEQGRPLSYEKGVYAGQSDEPLSEEARRQLDQRALQQGM